MKALAFCFTFLLLCGVGCQAFSLRQTFGICVEVCSTSADLASGILACPEGYECRSNGCGHTCQKVASTSLSSACPGVMCALYCESGYALNEHGCPICACAKSSVVA